jgi:hypothetical protein
MVYFILLKNLITTASKIESIEDKDESSDEDSEEEGMAITDVYNIHHRAKKTSRCLSNNSAETSRLYPHL